MSHNIQTQIKIKLLNKNPHKTNISPNNTIEMGHQHLITRNLHKNTTMTIKIMSFLKKIRKEE